MARKKENYQYLLRLYSLVDEYLSDVSGESDLPEIVIAFCIVIEKIFKIKLYKENPVLVYENAKIKDSNALISVIKGKELNIDTIKIRESIARYKLMFDGEFSDDEMQVLIDIYNIRNHFVHGFKSDEDILTDRENIVKKMGTVWEKISVMAVATFGKRIIKANEPKKKYSKEELENVLTEEVRKKIESYENKNSDFLHAGTFAFAHSNDYSCRPIDFSGEICPRCGACGFSKSDNGVNSLEFIRVNTNPLSAYPLSPSSNLYVCKKCNLELTEKEYEIAKKLKS